MTTNNAARSAHGPSQAKKTSAARIEQRSRLLGATIDVVAEDGYMQAKIGTIATRAGVSHSTFYELFGSKEECFLAAHDELGERLSAETEKAVVGAAPADGAAAALGALVGFAEREPSAFCLLTHQALLAGEQALMRRDRLIMKLAGTVERAWASAPKNARVPDMPTKTLLGGVIRAMGMHMRRHEVCPKQPLADLIRWIDCYGMPLRTHRWRSITPSAAVMDTRNEIASGPIPPQPLPKGRHRRPDMEVKRVQRERILHATARAIQAKGYDGMIVADIVGTAGLSREAFYAHFRNKQEAFAATVQLVFEQSIGNLAGAFYASSGNWPEQVWEGGRAFARFVADQPSLVHPIFIESYALDPTGTRTDTFLLAFTVFLEKGYRYRPESAQVPELASEAIAAAVLEVVTDCLRNNRAEDLPGLVPLLAYIVLAPFMGPRGASEFVDRQTGAKGVTGRTKKSRARANGPAVADGDGAIDATYAPTPGA